MTEGVLFVCEAPGMNIWDDAWGEQGEDWSGGGGLAKRLVRRDGALHRCRDPHVTGDRRVPGSEEGHGPVTHGIFFIHDVEEDA